MLCVFLGTSSFANSDRSYCESFYYDILLINQDNNIFKDETEARGLVYRATTWATALVDYDLDGDLDAFSAMDGDVSVVVVVWHGWCDVVW